MKSNMKKYRDFAGWIRECVGCKVQKISVDAGFSCPNRDGHIGTGGCTFCDNSTFSPAYCDRRKTVSEQIAEGKAFFRRKYPEMKYLAYFQSFSNTYAPLPRLRRLYEEALADEDVVGIVIGTRPDCVSPPLLDYLAELSDRTFVLVEYGVESVNDDTLRRVNRGHDFQCAVKAMRETTKRGVKAGAHIILGLPNDDEEETIAGIMQLYDAGMTLLKLHQLQIIHGTKMAEEYSSTPFHLYSAEEYMEVVVRFMRELPESIVYDRFVSQSPLGKVLAPNWGLKNHEFTDLLNKRLLLDRD